jgi:hypothetical protein
MPPDLIPTITVDVTIDSSNDASDCDETATSTEPTSLDDESETSPLSTVLEQDSDLMVPAMISEFVMVESPIPIITESLTGRKRSSSQAAYVTVATQPVNMVSNTKWRVCLPMKEWECRLKAQLQ